ncbi:MAG TPA: histidine kinase [Bacteroidales bacterium]
MHPLFIRSRNLVYYIIIWCVIAAVQTISLNHYYGLSHLISITDSLVFNALFSIIAVGLWYTVRFNSFDHRHIQDVIINHLGVALISLVIWFFSGYFLLHELFTTQADYIIFLNQSIPWRLATGLFFYALTVLVYYLIISYRDLQEKIQNEMELKTLVKETELSMLKSQINPHFLFNSLNSISSLTITNPTKAQEMIIKLSEFLRHSISHKEEQMVPMYEEVEHIMRYLEIEKVRFGDRLHYDFRINDSCKNFPVPSMILQPIFENAIKHGVYESTEEVVIDFTCDPDASGMLLRISNNFDPDSPPRRGNRMGIKNIVNRLKLIYQYDDLLKINKHDRTFEVILFLPKIHSEQTKNNQKNSIK